MAAQLHQRGPGCYGVEVFGDVGFGYNRLSIIDLAGSPEPMISATQTKALLPADCIPVVDKKAAEENYQKIFCEMRH
jgi:hypothetical protein